MNLQQIDVRCVETGERSVDGVEDRCTGETKLILALLEGFELGIEVGVNTWGVSHKTITFSEDEDLIARDIVLGNGYGDM